MITKKEVSKLLALRDEIMRQFHAGENIQLKIDEPFTLREIAYMFNTTRGNAHRAIKQVTKKKSLTQK